MGDLTAVILAAGMGVRMGPRGKLTPKGLIELGGASLVAQSVASLRAWGAARIVIVTGHLAEHYEAAFGDSDIELIYNPDFATTGSLLSLACALNQVDGPIAILESDVIYAPEALNAVDGSVNQFVVSGPTHAGDEVHIWTQRAANGAQHMLDISKDRAHRAEQPLGEMVGISALNAAATEHMRHVARRILAANPAEHYEPGLLELSKDMPIECLLLPDVAWAEIDDEDMLARAERLVLPRVLKSRQA